MKELHIGQSPLTNRIFCGSVSKNGRTWLGNKTDVTAEACAAVAEHVVKNSAPVTVFEEGKAKYKITVDVL